MLRANHLAKSYKQRQVVKDVSLEIQKGEIVGLLGNGSAYYAPATSGIEMAEAYLYDQKRLLPCAVNLTGQYGVSDLYVGVPVIIGAGGVERIVEINLSDSAKANFQVSVDAVKELLDACKALDSSLA